MAAIRVGTSSSGAPVLLMIDEAHRAFSDPMQMRTGKSNLVSLALSARRTVRITYHRASDLFEVTVRQGEQQLEWITSALPGKDWDFERVEAYIETQAASAARCRGLDVSRVDVP